MLKNTELNIWFCGFYEGEGSISNDKSNNNRLKLSISQNDRTPLDLGRNIWGGSVRERTRESKNKICHGHEWSLNHCQALQFVEDIKPYMRIPYKIEQLKNALEKAQKGYKGEYKCSFCEKIYTISANRRRHEVHQHIIKDQCFLCICGKKYMSRDSMKRHLKNCNVICQDADLCQNSDR
jgi:hypothetical protein